MKLKLTENFTARERNYINQYLAGITLGNHVTIGSGTVSKFLKRLSYRQDEQDEMLNREEKSTLATKLIEWIMQDEAAFIKIIMAETPMLHNISLLPPLKQDVSKVMEKAASILKSNKEAREALITSIVDIDILTNISTNTGRMFLKALFEANDLDRLLKSNKQLCQEINRFPQLTRFFVLSALKNKSLFNALFSSEGELSNLKYVLSGKNIPLPKDIEKSIEAKIAAEKSYGEIRKAARLLAQGYRDSHCLFARLSAEIDVLIASFTRNPQQHNEREAYQIAAKYFNKP